MNMFVSTCDKCLFESLLIMPQRNIVIDNTNNILDRIQNDTNSHLDFCGCLALLHVGAGVLLVPVLQPVLRCEEERLLGDVHPPPGHHRPDHVLLDDPLRADGDPRDDRARLQRPPARDGQAPPLRQLQPRQRVRAGRLHPGLGHIKVSHVARWPRVIWT